MNRVVFAIALAWGPAAALAQMPEVSPNGTPSEPAEPAPEAQQPAPQTPVVIPVGPDGKVQQPAEPEDEGFYYRDDLYPVYPGGGGMGGMGGGLGGAGVGGPLYVNGAVPETHVVRRGDTLWDITWFYFNNPYDWPKVWSYNPQITNPHWIYPGDQVKLYAQGQGPATPPQRLGQPDVEGGNQGDTGDAGRSGDETRPRRGSSRPPGAFSIRQVAFVGKSNLDFAAIVDGSTEEKLLLSTGDGVYLRYPKGRPPKVGKRYAIYRPRQEVEHPKTGKKLGAYVRVIGELEVVSVKKGKRARAIITDSTDVIERGALVGPLQRQFKQVEPTPAKRDVQGTIVAQLFADQLIGARQVVFIDKGSADGVAVGNRMYVVRRGDAYETLGGPPTAAGKDDRRFPARAIGEILVVDAGKNTSLALVTLSTQEIGVGDQVLMRRAEK